MNLRGWIGLAKEIAAFKSFELLLLSPPYFKCLQKVVSASWFQLKIMDSSPLRIEN